jgi:hypothetical protein
MSDRATITAGLIHNSKYVACFMVASAVFCTVSMSFYDTWWADLIPILIWVANYFVMTSLHAANQRLILIRDLIDAKDWAGVRRFAAVPHELHVQALLLFDDPMKLYRRP